MDFFNGIINWVYNTLASLGLGELGGEARGGRGGKAFHRQAAQRGRRTMWMLI